MTRRAPAFSVIIPTHDRADVLGRALRSVLAQTFGDLEVMVVDDGSTDETASNVEAIDDDRVRYLHQEQRGVSDARNAGAAATNGLYLTFLDSDDEASPEWLERLGRSLEKPGVAVVCCGAVLIREGDRAGRIRLPRDMGAPFEDQRGLFLAGSFALRRDVFEAVGGYAEGLPFSENTELGLRLVPLCRSRGWQIASLDESLLIIHERKERAELEAARFEGATYVLAHHREKLVRNRAVLGDYFAVAGVSAARLGRLQDSRRFLTRAVVAHPWNLKHHARLLVSLFPSAGRRLWMRASRPVGSQAGVDRS